MTDADLTQWARSLFSDISNPASLQKAQTSPAAADDGLAGPANDGDARTANTKPAPDFRYRPVVTGGKSIPHGGYVK